MLWIRRNGAGLFASNTPCSFHTEEITYRGNKLNLVISKISKEITFKLCHLYVRFWDLEFVSDLENIGARFLDQLTAAARALCWEPHNVSPVEASEEKAPCLPCFVRFVSVPRHPPPFVRCLTLSLLHCSSPHCLPQFLTHCDAVAFSSHIHYIFTSLWFLAFIKSHCSALSVLSPFNDREEALFC